MIDLRKHSLTLKNWYVKQLSTANHEMLYIPEGFALGYLIRADNSEVF